MIDWGKMETAETRAAAELAQRRATMKCSRLQARIVLGEAVCTALDAIAADPQEPWAVRQAILYAGEWHRNSETMEALAWAMGYTPEQADALFEAAMQVAL